MMEGDCERHPLPEHTHACPTSQKAKCDQDVERKNIKGSQGMVAHAHNPNTREARGLIVQRHPQLRSEF